MSAAQSCAPKMVGKRGEASRRPRARRLLSVQFVSEDEGWIVGRGGAILRSGDRGQTWVEQESGTKQNLYALFVDKKIGWAVGSRGLILKYQR